MVKQGTTGLLTVCPLQTGLMEKAAMQTEQDMLRAEIEFWRDMIKRRRVTVSEQATERMLNACELAERKLLTAQAASHIGKRQ